MNLFLNPQIVSHPTRMPRRRVAKERPQYAAAAIRPPPTDKSPSMSISMYQICVPVLVRAFDNLSAVLAKGAAHAAERNIAPEVLLNTRITPDMFPLIRQVQIATDMAKGAGARLAGVEPPKMD